MATISSVVNAASGPLYADESTTFTISGSGFGGSTGVVLVFPDVDGNMAPVPITSWNNTTIQGTLANTLQTFPAGSSETIFIVIPANSNLGVHSAVVDMRPLPSVFNPAVLSPGDVVQTTTQPDPSVDLPFGFDLYTGTFVATVLTEMLETFHLVNWVTSAGPVPIEVSNLVTLTKMTPYLAKVLATRALQ